MGLFRLRLGLCSGICCVKSLAQILLARRLLLLNYFGGGTRSTFNALLILAEEKRTFLLAVLDITEDIHFDHQRNANSTSEGLASPSVEVKQL